MGALPQVQDVPLTIPATFAPWEESRWYAVQTRARHEKKVATQLQGKGVAVYLPLIPQVHRWSDRSKVVQLPLFAGYAFVRTELSPVARLGVLQTAGVISFVGNHGQGIPIPDKEIEDVQALLTHKAPCALYPFLKVGQRVRIRGGCLDGVEGILAALDSKRSVVVSIELIQRSLAVRVEGFDVEPA